MQKNAPNVLPHATLMLTYLPSLYLYSPSPFSLTSAFFSLSLVSVPDRSYTSPSLWWTMAFCRIGTKPMLEGCDLLCSNGNQSTKLASSSCGSPSNFSKFVCITSPHHRFFTPRTYSISRPTDSSRRSSARLRCSAGNTVSPPESKENIRNISSICIEEESGHVTKFKISDFELCNHVSVGLAGRGDELIFEATVKDSHSPLYNSRVVLRQLTSSQAQRRGRRALEVLKKLVRRQLMYDSYAMQVHGYVSTSDGGDSSSFTLVHGYHGSYSLRHWLQLSDWLPTLEATLALDEECARKVGDATTGGPAISRQLRLIRILMRDLLIGVNYLHSLGLAHTELRLENVHISPVDRHIKVGILGNAADFYDNNLNNSTLEGNMDRRQLMIAFDMRCVGFMMAKMVLRELMDPSNFMKFKSFLMKGNDPSCLREFLLPILCRNSPSGNAGLQILDRNWGAGWNLLSRLLAMKPSERISCLDALRHPFLCGPRWRVDPSIDIIKWGLGSTAVRIAEEYIYGRYQRSRLAYFIELMEMLNTNPKAKDWLEILPGRWRLLYCTGRHIGLTLRQASPRVLIGHVFLTFMPSPDSDNTLSLASEIGFTVMPSTQWPHNKIGITGKLNVSSSVRLTAGSRLYLKEEKDGGKHSLHLLNAQGSVTRKLSSRKWRRASPIKELPSSLPVANLISDEVEVTMSIDSPTPQDVGAAGNVLREVRTQVPPEIFDLSKLICGTFLDSRMLVLRGVNGCALLFTRSCGL